MDVKELVELGVATIMEVRLVSVTCQKCGHTWRLSHSRKIPNTCSRCKCKNWWKKEKLGRPKKVVS